MPAITYTEARKHLGETIDGVVDDHQPVVITRANGKNAVLISQEDFDAWQETAYLLRSPANASDLRQAMAELGERRGLVQHDLIEE
ncbi:type II toxin-antitoxin system Phd/YefM family antitoxin [uncultured Thiodictyon sp.]|jgi:antitoxin YefM|uniref:type II toxin-antitoxin system Phd/YefM family antitoxin n=1 Tax=uncultured Thiodictyon sp. TaxID=1846217 RepID=UPI0025CF6A2A|nr:type II toxin-antitoxin system prevent-host-death family antitoxin [uncultured Thiodictyon sp.]